MNQVLSLWRGWIDQVEPDFRSPREKAMQIVAEAAEKHGVTAAKVMGRDLYRPVVLARHEAMARIAAMAWPNGTPRLSYPQIGHLFSRDHTSVIHAVRTHYARNGGEAPARSRKAA